jgi:hypothetical protein
MTSSRSVAASLAIVLILAGCGQTIPPSDLASAPPPAAGELPPPIAAPLPGRRWTFNDQAMASAVINLHAGPAHCGWETATFLGMGWPLGRVAHTSNEAREYIRDPDGLFAEQMLAPFIPFTILPETAFDTGYRYGADELWVDTATVDQVVYMVRGDVVEQWGRPPELVGCS